MSNDLKRRRVTDDRYFRIIWLCVLAAMTSLTGSTLAQIPETSDGDWVGRAAPQGG